ncbi:helix-turn-helix domain-containing protein [Streptomyces javensis]|uniref:Helix-turn-helix domain-containing protein n=1 Tax=Streptomyces javensis TaxID=114698 RepID=A0ABS0R534_9ACTN|nr:helix-turn-helix transcriptional regulator [Streptomyces javensis]MBI0312418.1 helix-turn-helix domain-containing protein [Streptomyces javensis]
MKDTTAPATASACARPTLALRELRARTGLSMAALAERTTYSKSSWERYLNGKQLAPRQAVEALCTMAGEPPGRLLALWELADGEWSGRAGGPPHPAEPDQRPGRRAGLRGWAAVGVAACVVGAAVAAAWVAILANTGSKDSAAHVASSTAPASPACHARGCVGKDPGLMGCGTPARVRALGPPLRTSTGARLRRNVFTPMVDPLTGGLMRAFARSMEAV